MLTTHYAPFFTESYPSNTHILAAKCAGPARRMVFPPCLLPEFSPASLGLPNRLALIGPASSNDVTAVRIDKPINLTNHTHTYTCTVTHSFTAAGQQNGKGAFFFCWHFLFGVFYLSFPTTCRAVAGAGIILFRFRVLRGFLFWWLKGYTLCCSIKTNRSAWQIAYTL